MTDETGSTSYTYSDYGRTITENRDLALASADFSMTTDYDWLGRVSSITYPDSEVVTYSYDAMGRNSEVESSVSGDLVDLAYNTIGQISTMDLGNGIQVQNCYESDTYRLESRRAADGSLQSCSVEDPEDTLINFRYEYDNVGNIISLSDLVKIEDFAFDYDSLNRLVSADGLASDRFVYRNAYSYDTIGNLVEFTGWNGVAAEEGIFQENYIGFWYLGTWTTESVASASDGSIMESDSAESEIRLEFEGQGFRYFREIGPDQGIAAIYLDGQLLEEVDNYNSTESSQDAVSFPCSEGEHLLIIRVNGDKNPASSGTTISLDAVEVLGEGILPTSTPTATATFTYTPTVSATPSPTLTLEGTPTASATATFTATLAATPTPSPTLTDQVAQSGIPEDIIVGYAGQCPQGWERVSGLDGLFPLGSQEYGGQGGASSHTHTYSDVPEHSHDIGSLEVATSGNHSHEIYFMGVLSTGYQYIKGGSQIGDWYSGSVSASGTHTHTLTGESASWGGENLETESASNIPPYLDLVFCSPAVASPENIPSGSILLFEELPQQNFERFSALDSRFPRGADTYGGTGGSETHSHFYVSIPAHTHDAGTLSLGDAGEHVHELLSVSTSADASPYFEMGENSGDSHNDAVSTSGDHNHTLTGETGQTGVENPETDATSNLPPYLDIIFGAATVNIPYISQGTVAMFSGQSCPVGWIQFSELDGRLPRGAEDYGTTGGSEQHSHTYSEVPLHAHAAGTYQTSTNGAHSHDLIYIGSSGGSYPYVTGSNDQGSWQGGSISEAGEHTHTLTGAPGVSGVADAETESTTVLPPYLHVLYCQYAPGTQASTATPTPTNTTEPWPTSVSQTPQLAGEYEDTAAEWYFLGSWTQITDGEGDSGSSRKETTASQSGAQLTFTGDGVHYYFRQGPAFGMAEIYIDQIKITSVDLYAETETAVQSVSVSITRGGHTLEIRRAGRRNTASTGFEINLDKVVILDAGIITSTPTPSQTLTFTPTPTSTSTPPSVDSLSAYDGFEVGSLYRAAGYSGSVSVESGIALYSDYCLKIAENGWYEARVKPFNTDGRHSGYYPPANSNMVAFRISEWPYADSIIIRNQGSYNASVILDAETRQLGININGVSGTELGSYRLEAGDWYFLSFWDEGESNGNVYMVLRNLDGDVLDSAEKSRQGHSNSTSQLRLYAENGLEISYDNWVWGRAESGSDVYDLFYDLGSDYRIAALLPDGPGELTSVPHGDYTDLVERPQDGGSTVVGFNHAETYTASLQDLTSIESYMVESILSVISYGIVGPFQAETGHARLVTRFYSTNYSTDDLKVAWSYTATTGSGYSHRGRVFLSNPYTSSSWTTSEVNDLEVGVHQQGTDGKIGVTFVMAEVLYRVDTTQLNPTPTPTLAATPTETPSPNGHTIQNIEGFEIGSGRRAAKTIGSISIQSETTWNSDYALRVNPTSYKAYYELRMTYNSDGLHSGAGLPAKAVLFTFRVAQLPSATAAILDLSGDNPAYLKLNSSGRLLIYEGSNLRSTGEYELETGTWYFISVLDDGTAAGSNKIQVILRSTDGTVLDVLYGDRTGTNNTSRIFLGLTGSGITVDVYFDNVIIEGAGTAAEVGDPFLLVGKDVRISALLPNGEGYWQQQDGGDYTCIDERPQDAGSTVVGFVYQRLYSAELQDLSDVEDKSVESIYGVVTYANVGPWQAEQGHSGLLTHTYNTDYITTDIKTGNDYNSTGAGGYAHRAQVYANNPYTGQSWTESEVNNLQVGVKKYGSSRSDGKTGVTFVMAEVLYSVDMNSAGFDHEFYTYSSSQPHAVVEIEDSLENSDTFDYDNAGNMTTRDEDGTEWTQAFSPDNRLEQVTDGEDTWTFIYDGDGVRTIQENPDGTTTAFLFGGLYEVALDSQGDTTAVKRYYTSSAGRVALRDSDGVHFLLTDHLGSVVAVLDDQGAVESEQRYLPYGGERYATGIDETDYGYTGQRDLQDLGLMDYNARFYSPSIRRFISADTLIPDPSSSQAFNRYSYVAGNPLVFNDPSGHYWVENEEQEGPTERFVRRFVETEVKIRIQRRNQDKEEERVIEYLTSIPDCWHCSGTPAGWDPILYWIKDNPNETGFFFGIATSGAFSTTEIQGGLELFTYHDRTGLFFTSGENAAWGVGGDIEIYTGVEWGLNSFDDHTGPGQQVSGAISYLSQGISIAYSYGEGEIFSREGSKSITIGYAPGAMFSFGGGATLSTLLFEFPIIER